MFLSDQGDYHSFVLGLKEGSLVMLPSFKLLFVPMTTFSEPIESSHDVW